MSLVGMFHNRSVYYSSYGNSQYDEVMSHGGVTAKDRKSTCNSTKSRSLQLASVHHVFKTDSCENSLPVTICVFSFSVSGLNFSL